MAALGIEGLVDTEGFVDIVEGRWGIVEAVMPVGNHILVGVRDIQDFGGIEDIVEGIVELVPRVVVAEDDFVAVDAVEVFAIDALFAVAVHFLALPFRHDALHLRMVLPEKILYTYPASTFVSHF